MSFEDWCWPLQPTKSYQLGSVTVLRFEADFDCLEWQTLSHMLGFLPPPFSESETRLFFGEAVRIITGECRKSYEPNIFANPICRISSDISSDKFVSSAMRLQAEWHQQIKASLGTLNPPIMVKDRRTRKILSQLILSGVMIAERRHRFPGDRPKPIDQRCKVGRRFGRLVVESVLRSQRCKCNCDCGKSTVVKSCHLISEKTKSCGCLRDEVHARAKLGKQRRRWRNNGSI